ncbi:MAG: hypothetical protein PHR16_13410 [Methylovulum sp.]|nr:hypothetical protein [Methylovulum sp.]
MLGIWGLAEYAPIAAQTLTAAGHGGLDAGDGQSCCRAAYQTDGDALNAVGWTYSLNRASYQGKTIEVRGWLTHSRQGVSMRLRYPSALKLLP